MIDVSVIIPVYNSEKYLLACVESILSQSFKNFELILVDDGSKDSSGKICDEYSDKDDRVITVHKSNGGLCSARNKGLELARGEYIAFCDNDDVYLPGLLEDNYSLAVKHDADVVRFLRRRIAEYEDGSKKINDGSMTGICVDSDVAVMETPELIASYDKLKQANTLNTIWNGLYRRSLVIDNDIRFDTRMKFGGEDILFNLNVLSVAARYVFNDKVYYQYNKTFAQSTSAKFSFNRVEAMLIYADKERNLIRENGLDGALWSNYQTSYAILSAGLLNHSNCDWSRKKKRAALNTLLKKSVLGRNTDGSSINKIHKTIWKYSKGRAIMAYLFEHRMFGSMLTVVKIYDSLPGHQSFGL